MRIRQRIRNGIDWYFFPAALAVVSLLARGREAYRKDMACQSHLLIVEAAIARITESAGEPLTVADLCRATHVSERTLRNAFHDVYGISPKQFLIRHGLEQARRALLEAGEERGTVTRVATECGFFELGRFAGAYRHLFGECPSDTLRNRTVAAAA